MYTTVTRLHQSLQQVYNGLLPYQCGLPPTIKNDPPLRRRHGRGEGFGTHANLEFRSFEIWNARSLRVLGMSFISGCGPVYILSVANVIHDFKASSGLFIFCKMSRRYGI